MEQIRNIAVLGMGALGSFLARQLQSADGVRLYGIVRDLVGHGIGRSLHEDPQIPNFRQKRRGIRLVPGMTLAVEPMITMGTWEVEWLDDDWTVVTADGSLAAHYENTILITEGEPEILTLTKHRPVSR